MVTILNFKPTIDLLKWRPLTNPITNIGGTTGAVYINSCSDLRNNESRNPLIYFCVGSGSLHIYSPIGEDWQFHTTSALTAFPITAMFFMSGQGPRGTLAAGATTTTVTLTTALPASVGVNTLANKGDDVGFKIRIIGNSAGGSGKTEERTIITNTLGTTPTITLDSALSFTPALGDAYEFLSGRVYCLGSQPVAGSWKYYDVATNSVSGNLSTVNLPASWNGLAGGAALVGLDEQLVPYDKTPGEGFLGILTATGSAAGTLTGQVAGGDASVLANEYRNFQIRIVEDIAIPTAVGQRRNITSHTAGPSPVYTVPAWAVVPSATARYVIENNGDRIIAWITNTTGTFTYSISGDAWDLNTTFAIRPDTINLARAVQAFSIEPDSAKNARHSFIYTLANTSTGIDLFDIAGAATGLWTQYIVNRSVNTASFLTAGIGSIQDPFTEDGRYWYLNNTFGGVMLIFRFDMKNRNTEPVVRLKIPFGLPTSTTAVNPFSINLFIDGSTKLSFLNYLVSKSDYSGTQFFQLPLTIG